MLPRCASLANVELSFGDQSTGCWHWSGRCGTRLCFEITSAIQIGDESGLNWAPSQLCLRSCARSRQIHARERRKPAKMIGRFLGGLADDRHVEVPADHASDLSEWHSFFGDRVIAGSRG